MNNCTATPPTSSVCSTSTSPSPSPLSLPPSSEIRQPLGFWKLTALVAGNMIGSGIFILPDDLARIGAASFIAWGTTALGAFLLALMLSRMSQLVPQSGGPYAYVRNGLGDFAAFQTAYNHWIAMWVGNIALVIALVGYLAMIFPILLHPAYGIAVAITILWLLTIVNITGVQRAGSLQLWLTILKLLPIVGLTLIGFCYFHPEYISEYINNANYSYLHITAASSLTLWAFIGVESATAPYKFVENPRRNIPLATLIGTAFAAFIYISSSAMLMGLLPPQVLGASPSPFVTAASLIFGAWGKWVMVVGAIVSCFGCINGWMLVQGQVTLAAARHNLFPGIFSITNKHGIAVLGLIVTTILQTIILVVTLDQNIRQQFQLIILMAALAALIPYLYSSLAALLVLKRQAGGMIKFTDKLLFLIAAAAAIYAFWSITISGAKVILYGSILVFTSALLYGWCYGDTQYDNARDEGDEEGDCGGAGDGEGNI